MNRIALIWAASALCAWAQAPREFLSQFPPSKSTEWATIAYTNPYDQSPGEALVEVPRNLNGPLPLIVTPHAANWTQEMNSSVWSGVAEKFGVVVLYPRHQGKVNPRVSFGSPRQLANLQASIDEVERRYSVDKSRVYVAGLSQGALETLLMVGHHAKEFAGALSINPVVDLLAFYEDLTPGAAVEPAVSEPLQKLRQAQWPALHKLMEVDFGGTPDTARPEYHLRSPVLFARELAATPLILYWAEDDELIPFGAAHQGGMLAQVIRAFHPAGLREVKHSGGHGYPFYQYDLGRMTVAMPSREIFLGLVKEMLGGRVR